LGIPGAVTGRAHPLVAVSDFVKVLVKRHVSALGEDPAFDPPDVARADRCEATRLPSPTEIVVNKNKFTTGTTLATAFCAARGRYLRWMGIAIRARRARPLVFGAAAKG
jgi:hypothetical protein